MRQESPALGEDWVVRTADEICRRNGLPATRAMVNKFMAIYSTGLAEHAHEPQYLRICLHAFIYRHHRCSGKITPSRFTDGEITSAVLKNAIRKIEALETALSDAGDPTSPEVSRDSVPAGAVCNLYRICK